MPDEDEGVIVPQFPVIYDNQSKNVLETNEATIQNMKFGIIDEQLEIDKGETDLEDRDENEDVIGT